MKYGPNAKDKGNETNSHISVNDVWWQSMRSYLITLFPLTSAGPHVRAPI